MAFKLREIVKKGLTKIKGRSKSAPAPKTKPVQTETINTTGIRSVKSQTQENGEVVKSWGADATQEIHYRPDGSYYVNFDRTFTLNVPHPEPANKKPQVMERLILNSEGYGDQKYLVATKYKGPDGKIFIKQETFKNIGVEDLDLFNNNPQKYIEKVHEYMQITMSEGGVPDLSDQILYNMNKSRKFFKNGYAANDSKQLKKLIEAYPDRDPKEIASKFLQDPEKYKNCYKDMLSAFSQAISRVICNQKAELENMAHDGELVQDDLSEVNDNIDLYIQNQNELYKMIDNIKDGKMSMADYQEFLRIEKGLHEFASSACQQFSNAVNNSKSNENKTSKSI